MKAALFSTSIKSSALALLFRSFKAALRVPGRMIAARQSVGRRLLLLLCALMLPVFSQGQTPAEADSSFSVLPKTSSVPACQANASALPSGTATDKSAPQCAQLPPPRGIRITSFQNGKEPVSSDLASTMSGATVQSTSPGPANAHLTYFGGPVLSNVEVVVVYWGNNVSPVVTNSIPDFYKTIVDSTYLDLLYEYSTTGNKSPGGVTTNQPIGHGVTVGPITIIPAATGTKLTDGTVRGEIQAQIAAGHLPAPVNDSQGNSNTLYAVYFPPGVSVSLGDASTCQVGGYCGYHAAGNTKGTSGQVFQYSVLPDYGPGSGCDAGCGTSTQINNLTTVSSHELAEAVTDAQLALATSNGPPIGWYDSNNDEIADICGNDQANLSAHGKTFAVSLLWSNEQKVCTNGPSASFVVSGTPTSASAGTSVLVTITIKNSAGQVLPFYTGTVSFSSTDTAATLPANYTFSASDNGAHTFNVVFNTPGSQTVSVQDVDVTNPTITGTSASVTVSSASKTTPSITWATPAAITYGTPLSSTQLNATSPVPGTFVYSPSAGTVLSAGQQTLRVTFTPTDTTHYTTAASSVTLQVNQQSQTITFPAPTSQAAGTTITLQATASSTLAVTLASQTPSVCTVSGAVANLIAAGNCTIQATQAGNTNYSAAPSILRTFAVTSSSPATGTPFVTGESPGQLRNNYTGFVGFRFTVGNNPLSVTSLGRIVAPGNTGTHLVKLVTASTGADVANGSVSVSVNGGAPGQFKFVSLANPITLLANTSYYLVSQETLGGDQWYDDGPITATTAATVDGPAYTDANNNYVALTNLAGQGFVPVSFLYNPPATTLSARITAPTNGGTVSGGNVPVTVLTAGPVTSLQLKVDGVNNGSPVAVSVNQGPSYTVSLDTTNLTNGQHALTAVASDAQNNMATTAAILVAVSNSTSGNIPFVVSESLGSLRNNYTGFVGVSVTIGGEPITVTSLGRFVAPGNGGSHQLKLVDSSGADLPGGMATISLAGSTPGQFRYAALSSGPLTLHANTTYYLVSQETAGGDQWYDYSPVSTNAAAGVNGPVYTDGGNNYVTLGGLQGRSYVPVSLLFGPAASTLSIAIAAPQTGALIYGNSVPVTVTTTGSVSSLQLKVDGVNQGNPLIVSPNQTQPYTLTLDTTTLNNGQHTITVLASGVSSSAMSPGSVVTVDNGGSISTFITSQHPGAVRNNYTGFIGMSFTVGATPLLVNSLGRYVVSGNTGSHMLKLVQANGAVVPGGSISLSLAGATPGQYKYAPLANPVTLQAGTTYFVVSQEAYGGDMWYDLGPVTSTNTAQVVGPAYTDGNGNYVVVSGLANYSYVPVSFNYQ